MMNPLILISLLLIYISPCVFAQKPFLTLVYKEAGKSPYIQESPDSSGLYLDMMKMASARIGFDLIVERSPKKRTYSSLKQGKVDLYASGEFKDYRSEFLYYFPNGLHRYEEYYGLTPIDIPELNSIHDISRYGLKWLVELGSSQSKQAMALGVKFHEHNDAVHIGTAIQLLSIGRPFIYRVIKTDLKKHMKKHNIISMQRLGIRIQHNSFKSTSAKLYASFSRFSPYYKEQPNPLYDSSKPLSAENFPHELVPGSVAYRFKQALHDMINSGDITALKLKYSIK